MTDKITVEKCSCGHKSCKDYWLSGIGKFVQGSGFTEAEANAIAEAMNSYIEAPTYATREDVFCRGCDEPDILEEHKVGCAVEAIGKLE